MQPQNQKVCEGTGRFPVAGSVDESEQRRYTDADGTCPVCGRRRSLDLSGKLVEHTSTPRATA